MNVFVFRGAAFLTSGKELGPDSEEGHARDGRVVGMVIEIVRKDSWATPDSRLPIQRTNVTVMV